MQEPVFTYDVFLSHSSKDKAAVRPLAERLRQDGLKVWFDEWALKPGDSIPAKIEDGLEHSRVLVLCMSANAFGSDWAQLEAGTFRFRDPLNQERRFIPLRLDDAPIKGSLAQFLYINWRPAEREQEYAKLLAACRFLDTEFASANEFHGPPASSHAVPLDLIEERIQGYYLDANRYTSVKLFLTPSLYNGLPMVAKPTLVTRLREMGSLHLIHPEVGLGMLPEKSVQEFFAMAKNLEEYERRKLLPQDGGQFEQTVRKWIDEKADETPHLIQAHFRERFLCGQSIPKPERDLVSDWERRYRPIIWPLVRFTFHVGNLYRCELKEIVALCMHPEECRWIELTCAGGSERIESCDLFSSAPFYRFRYLPPLRALICPPEMDRLMQTVHGLFS